MVNKIMKTCPQTHICKTGQKMCKKKEMRVFPELWATEIFI